MPLSLRELPPVSTLLVRLLPLVRLPLLVMEQRTPPGHLHLMSR